MEANTNEENREDLVFIIDLAFQAELYDDMWQGIKKLVRFDEFTREERCLFDLLMKTRARQFRVAYGKIRDIEMKLEVKQKDRKWKLCSIYLQKLKDDHEKFLRDAIKLIDNNVIPMIQEIPELVQWYRYKSHYWQQIQDLKQNNDQDEAINQARISYETGMEYIKQLDDIDPAKLGFVLNYSVFIYERLNDPLRAVAMASELFHAALPKTDALDNDEREIMLMLHLMRDNIVSWTDDGFDPKTGRNRAVNNDGNEED